MRELQVSCRAAHLSCRSTKSAVGGRRWNEVSGGKQRVGPSSSKSTLSAQRREQSMWRHFVLREKRSRCSAN